MSCPLDLLDVCTIFCPTDELSADFATTMSKANTDSYLEKLGEQTCGKAFKELLEAAGIAAEHTLKPLAYIDNKATETQGWFLWDPKAKTLCIAWRGTEQEKTTDFFTDANLLPWSYQCTAEEDGRVTRKDCLPIMTLAGTWVHAGFLKGFDSVRETMAQFVDDVMEGAQEPWTLWITGHSLGGALATLSAHELSLRKYNKCARPMITMYNFGSPRVGNQQFVDEYNKMLPNSWRVANKNDVVTNIPQMAVGYRHVGNKAKLDVGGTITYKLQPAATGASTVEGEVDTDDVIEALDGGLKLDAAEVAADMAAASAVSTDPSNPNAGQKATGLKFVWKQAGNKMGTIMDGRAINDHMEDVYLVNLYGVYEKWYGQVKDFAASLAAKAASAQAASTQAAGGGTA